MNKKMIWLSALALSMSISQATLACDCGRDWTPGDRMEKMTESLDLTADQKAKIKAIGTQAKESMKPKMVEMRDIRMQLNTLADAKVLDEGKIDALISQRKEIMGTIVKGRLMVRHDISMILTDAQKAKLAQMVAAWKAKHMDQE